MAQKPQKLSLPGKEASLFKQVVKFYEGRQYKKGIKTADQILKKYPTHGETLSMKGLILNCMERKEEAYDHVKRGVKEDLTSHVSWHVFGLLYKSDREYNEAIKCYRNALRHDKENLQILRDLSWLQVHLRDLEGFMETRRLLLTIKPQQKAHWTAFALGAHLAKDYAKAISILDEYEKTMEVPEKPDFETSEFVLYKEMVLEESGDYQTALNYLNKSEKLIVDKLHLKERRADLLFKLGRAAESEQQYRELIQINSEHNEYYAGLQQAMGLSSANLTSEQLSKLTALYDELATLYPKSDSCKRIPLQFLQGDAFASKLAEYLKNGIRKGVPSLFISLKFIYKDSSKVTILQNLVKSFVDSLTSSKKFPNSDKVEAPDAILWTKFFLSQHYDVIGDAKSALSLIDEAISHTPTVIELYVIKAKIYKHAGDLSLCSQFLEKARQMDLADRYLNNRSSKYLLRTDQIEKTISTLGLFTKEGDDVEKYLTDMQCMWFEQECGNAHYRLQNYGKALKKFTSIDKHFADITEDQFDFHTYCLRKMTLRSYVKMLRLEDGLYSYKYYVNAAKSIIKTYIHVFDHPSVKESNKNNSELDNMSEEDRKKFLKKQKKDQLKKEEEEKERQKKAGNNSTVKKVVDPDPEGLLLLEGDLLEKASKYLQILYKSSPNDVEALLLAVQVYLRKKKYLLALRALKKCVNSENAQVAKNVVQFFKTVETELEKLNPVVRDLIVQERANILGNKTLEDYQKSMKSTSFSEKLAFAQSFLLLHPDKQSSALQLAIQVETSSTTYSQLEDAQALYSFVNNLDSSSGNILKTKLHTLFPFAVAFMNENDLKVRSEEISKNEEQQQPNENQNN